MSPRKKISIGVSLHPDSIEKSERQRGGMPLNPYVAELFRWAVDELDIRAEIYGDHRPYAARNAYDPLPDDYRLAHSTNIAVVDPDEEKERWRQDSVLLNRLGYRVARVLGKVVVDGEDYHGDVEADLWELIGRFSITEGTR